MADDKIVYIAVGDALSKWENLEGFMSVLFGVVVESKTIAAVRAYGSILGAKARADALQQAGETYFLVRRGIYERDRTLVDIIDKNHETFRRVIRNYVLSSARRNDIAHGLAWNLNNNAEKKPAWFLVAPTYQSSKTKSWIIEELSLRRNRGVTFRHPSARDAFCKAYRESTEYVYGVRDIKYQTGKFMRFAIQILWLAEYLHPGLFPEAVLSAARLNPS